MMQNGARRFETTRWSIIVAAGNEAISTEERRDALEHICRNYWFPAYSYVRSRGYRQEDAQDLTQEFFTRLLDKDALHVAEKERGRFRSFLLASLRNFLSDEWDKAQAQKRGGGIQHQSLDIETAETLFAEAADKPLTPDQMFDLHWAKTTLAHALDRVEAVYGDSGKEHHFRTLRPFLGANGLRTSYAEAAQELGISEGAVKVAIHRLRKRYREALELEVAETLTRGEDLPEEMKYLIGRLTL
jgi:RNA polymerase sigma-70 factor (ECF subfamily)